MSYHKHEQSKFTSIHLFGLKLNESASFYNKNEKKMLECVNRFLVFKMKSDILCRLILPILLIIMV